MDAKIIHDLKNRSHSPGKFHFYLIDFKNCYTKPHCYSAMHFDAITLNLAYYKLIKLNKYVM